MRLVHLKHPVQARDGYQCPSPRKGKKSSFGGWRVRKRLLSAPLCLSATTAEARFDTDASSVAKIKARKHRVSDEFLHDEP
jgi:hypothetical protein